jgi:peptidoglycan/xylan/chitin deacetylase (PgdA/CDA1 family)
VDGHSSEQLRARREAHARAVARRRLTVLAGLLAAGAIAALSLGRQAPAGAPAAPIAPPAAVQAPVGARAARLAAQDRAVDRVLAYTPFVARGSARSREIALTFDDGPGPSTPALVRYLITNGVPATFFLVGKAIAERPDVVARQIRAGFALGTHTEGHRRLTARTLDEQTDAILDSADRITRLTGHSVRLFRPPYGAFDADTLGVLRARRMLMVLWSIDTRDYAARRPRQIVDAVLRDARAGAIVLMHDGPGRRPQTLTAVRRLVPALRRRGYRLVSLPDLLRDDPPPRDQKLPRSFGG